MTNVKKGMTGGEGIVGTLNVETSGKERNVGTLNVGERGS
jgi:hypothetical protein